MEQELVTIGLGDGERQMPELVQFGFSLPRGRYQSHTLSLCDECGSPIEASIEPVSYWPDQSLRWCFARILVAPESGPELKVLARLNRSSFDGSNRPQLVESLEGALLISTQNCSFRVNTSELYSFSAHLPGQSPICDAQPFQLELEEGLLLSGKITDTSHRTHYSGSEPLLVEVLQTGVWVQPNSSLAVAAFEQKLSFHYASGRVELSLTLHNPKAAVHEGGTWDLGDPHSLLFKSASYRWQLPELDQASCLDQQSQTLLVKQASTLNLYQESSGGMAWNSQTHLNREARVPMSLKGYRLEADQSEEIGERVDPWLHLQCGQSLLGVGYPLFWQNFPSSLSVQQGVLELSLFPAQFPDLHELQPGERKTQTLSFVVSDSKVPAGPFSAKISWAQERLISSQALPWLTAEKPDDRVQQLIRRGTSGESSLLAKRELADEYGWRNFGELYADHESEGYQEEGLFVSHYNNQYDPIFGLYRQAIQQSDLSLYQQARDLAQHVTDIDLYHTDLDKDEYNHGLFWHTDHYQKCETCTHRTYSKRHQSGVYEDHAGGGGPGGQHCYTTGLLLDYWLTGNQHSKQAVLQLADWITVLYEGRGSFIELLLNWKNRYRQDVKNFFTGRYPLDRGVGNYIVALLDAFAITHQTQLLAQVAEIIQETVHPLDDFSQRNFDDVEETWFYTVFLQAVARYLWVKFERNELDEDFLYGRDCLSHYAGWMVDNEELALNSPDRLEFPNLTWTAQDLRKVNVLYLASFFDDTNRARFQTKAEALYVQAVAALGADPTYTYTRIQAILMQNHGVREWVQAQPQQKFPVKGSYRPIGYSSKAFRLKRLLMSLWRCTLGFSVSKELDQLRRRFPQLTKFVGPLK